MDSPSAGPAHLCETCEVALARLFANDRDKTIEHHEGYQSLQRSQRQGCFICCAVSSKGPEFLYSRIACGETNRRYLTVRFFDKAEGKSRGVLFHVQKARDEQELARINHASRIAMTTADNRVTQMAHWWLKNCLQNHEACQKNLKPQWYPRRLLRLEADFVYLIHTATENLDRPYVTLSHCWGGAKFTTLTEENMATFTSGIRTSNLPMNFQHIVGIARRLNIDYIWIDCYCIMQSGSDVDKLLELQEMDEVYANAMLNIGATCAQSPYESCLVKRVPLESRYAIFTWRLDGTADEQRSLICLSLHSSRSDRFKKTLYDNWSGLFESPILSRAWILQERLLCPRMVHLAQPQIYWECREVLPASEDMPYGIECFSQTQGNNRAPYPLPFSIDADHQRACLQYQTRTFCTPPTLMLYRSWSKIVLQYSKMHLSYPEKDKLVAIGAIAKRAASVLNVKYTAGIMHTEFLHQLRWTVYRDNSFDTPRRSHNQESKRATCWRAPSWSWASVDGTILLPDAPQHSFHEDARTYASVIDWHVELVDPDNDFGPVRSGSLRLHGRLIQYGTISKLVNQEHHVSIKPTFDDDRDSAQDSLFMIATWGDRRSPIPGPDYLGIYGLLVKPDCKPETYRRVGVFEAEAGLESMIEEVLTHPDNQQIVTLI